MKSKHNITPMFSKSSKKIVGKLIVAGDKSISHRSLIIASQIIGTTSISGLLEGEDVLRTADALRSLGVNIERKSEGNWIVEGVGVGGLSESADVLDMGNSGTGARLLMGLVSTYNFTTFFSGDDSLRSRPMQRVVDPLLQMGVKFHARSKGRLPLALIGSGDTMPIEYIMPVDSAQVKSAILLAGLNTAGKTTVIEQKPTRDHSEKMLAYFGWQLETEKLENGAIAISIIGKQALQRKDYKITVPGDPSSAAFLAVAALIVPGSDITIENITVNPLRIGLYTTLQEMGGNIEFINKRIEAGEEVADIRVCYSKLQGVTVPASRSPSMIDEYPILAVAASYATGKTIMHGLAELKVKESDRLTAIASGLKQCGVNAEIDGNDLMIEGCEQPYGGATITTNFDHRIAMSFLVMGMASKNEVKIDDASSIATSFPNFVELMNRLGANMYYDASDVVGQEKYKPLTIAIDGPAASGKGTLARRIAEHFGYSYLDTGSIYRAVGLKLIYSAKDPYDKRSAIDSALALSEQDLTNPRLRQERIGQAASIISSIPEVRTILLDFQRNFAKSPKGAVLDGRDIGTVVCPQADIKIFITANLETRAKRRHRELQGEGIEVVYQSVYDDLYERDERDAERNVAPLIAAEDSIIVDSSDLSANEVFDKVVAIVKNKLGKI